MPFILGGDARRLIPLDYGSMKFPEVLKQPPTFVAAALVTACLVALLAAIGGFLAIDGATRTALAVTPVSTSSADNGEATLDKSAAVPAMQAAR